MNGAESAMAAHANVAAPAAFTVASVHRQAIAAESAPIAIEQPDRALVAGQRIHRRKDHREADRVNRIDLAVCAARQVVRLEIDR